MKKLLLLLFCCSALVSSAYAQAVISYYPITSYVGVSTNTNHRCWADLRLQTNTFIGFTNIEFSPKINLKQTEMAKTYVGFGINFNMLQGSYNDKYVNGYFLCVGVIVSPFKTLRGFSFIFEASPYANDLFTDGMIRTTLGISWQFNKKRKINIIQPEDEKRNK